MLALASMLSSAPALAAPIIADHNAVADFDKIPQVYIDKVKAMWVSVPGESHSLGYRLGCQVLQYQDPRFPVLVRDSGVPDGPTATALRINRATWGNVSGNTNWVYDYGEEDWFTSPLAIQRTKVSLDHCNSGGLTLNAFGFGWCWDMSWHNNPGGGVDPVYQVRWGGSTVGGPQGDLRWGLDADDTALTGNSVCLDTYIDATEQYIAHCKANGYPTVVFFTTGPADNGASASEGDYQRHLKQERIRAHVRASADRVLFDYADILCWNNAGQIQNSTWNPGGGIVRTFPTIHPDNMIDLNGGYAEDGDHIGQRGAARLARAMWWMLARIAGWNGSPSGPDIAPPTGAITINAGDAWTSSTSVTLTLSASDEDGGSGVESMRFSADGLAWGAWEPFAASCAWSFAGGEGLQTVYVQFRDAAQNVSESFSDSIQIYTELPAITQHPASATVNSGASVLFSVAANSAAPLTYQWKKNGAVIDGATASSYAIASAAAGDVGSYLCEVTNILGTVVSNAAALSINDSFSFALQPASQTVNPGSSVAFAVAVTGPGTFTYQWTKNGVNIGGANADTLNLGSVTTADAGYYACVVTNMGGSVSSAAARLVVHPTLTVVSARGLPTPACGSCAFTTGSLVSAMVSGSPELDTTGTTRFVVTGWTGTGSAPASGVTTQTAFTLVQDSTLTWNWKTQFKLTASASAGGRVALLDGSTSNTTSSGSAQGAVMAPAGASTAGGSWHDLGASVTLKAIANPGYVFQGWFGDASGSATTASLAITRPRSVNASFAPQGAITASPMSLRFLEGGSGAVDVEHGGAPTTKALALTNTGGVAVSFTGGSAGTPGLALSGRCAGDYAIQSVTPATSAPLAPGASVTVTIRFAPKATRRTLGLDAALVVTSDSPVNPSLSIPLVGDAVPVELSGFTAE